MKTSPGLTDHADHIIHSLALQAGRRLNSYRLLLGRCLLEAQRRRYYVEYGCSTLTHYIVYILKADKKEARACLRVATRLEELPKIADEAERGLIDWSKLRDTVHKVTPRTEEFWLELYERLSYSQLMYLARRTPVGGIPGDPGEAQKGPDATELICRLDPEADALVSRGLRALSRQEGRVVSFNEAVVVFFADYLSGVPDEPAGEVKREAECRRQVLDEKVEWARELAGEMGLEPCPDCPARDHEMRDNDETRDNEMEGAELFQALVAYQEESLPGNESVAVARRDREAQDRLRFNPENRCPTSAQRHHLTRRERYCCAVPGCQNHIWLEAHHLVAYALGGLTVPSNLLMLCSSCHRLVHRGKLKISGEAPERLYFTDAQGRSLERDARRDPPSFLEMWVDYSLRFWMGEVTGESEVVTGAGQPPPIRVCESNLD